MSKVSPSSRESSPTHQETKESCSQGNKIHCVCQKENCFKKLLETEVQAEMRGKKEERAGDPILI